MKKDEKVTMEFSMMEMANLLEAVKETMESPNNKQDKEKMADYKQLFGKLLKKYIG